MSELNKNIKQDDSISLSEIIISMRKASQYLAKRWIVVVIFAIIGGALGVINAINTEPLYKSQIKFTLEEDRAAASSMSAYASSNGFNSDMSGGGNLLIGDKLLGLLTSRVVVKKALLNSFDTAGKKSIADRFAEIYKMKEEWAKTNANKSDYTFSPVTDIPDYTRETRTKSAYFQAIVNKAITTISVNKPEQKMTFVNCIVSTENEQLSKRFNEVLIQEVEAYYVEFKTQKLRQNIVTISARLDSLLKKNSSKSYGMARQKSLALDVNPAFQEVLVPIESFGRDKTLLQSSINMAYYKLDQSIEALTMQTPILTLIDDVELPLSVERASKTRNAISGILVGAILAIMLLFFIHLFKKYK